MRATLLGMLSILTEDFFVDFYMKEPQMHRFSQMSRINFISEKSVFINESVAKNMFTFSSTQA